MKFTSRSGRDTLTPPKAANRALLGTFKNSKDFLPPSCENAGVDAIQSRPRSSLFTIKSACKLFNYGYKVKVRKSRSSSDLRKRKRHLLFHFIFHQRNF